MTVYLPPRATAWRYDFQLQGQRYTGSTGQTRKADALLVEAQEKITIRQRLAGLRPFLPEDTPTFTKWARVYLAMQQRFTRRPDLAQRAVDVVLEFWGARPSTPRKAPAVPRRRRVSAPYHDLRLGHPIADSSWLLKFQQWIDARGVSGSTRNTYLSTLSGFYRTALQPEYRHLTGVTTNPFAQIRRSPPNRRLVALPAEVVLAWIAAAPYHVALAATIAALAPKLRLQTILALEWPVHFDRDTTRITVHVHKTVSRSGLPQVTPLSAQLAAILQAARAASTHRHVITYHNQPVASIKTATRRAARDVGLTWGLRDGVTFHTIRHSIATILAELGVAERLRMELLGHREIRTTQQYTHLAASSQIDPHEQLSAALPLEAVIRGKQAKMCIGKSTGTADPDLQKVAAIRPQPIKATRRHRAS